MDRTETVVVRLVIGVSALVLPTVAFWWGTVSVAMTIAPDVGEDTVRMAAAIGLAIGVILAITRLRHWVDRFYSAGVFLMFTFYLAWSAVATAFLMGLPLSVLVTGTAAGLYTGRRLHHAGQTREVLRCRARTVGLMTAALTGTWTFLIGVLALGEDLVAEILHVTIGMDQAALAGWQGIALAIAGGTILFFVQLWCTAAAARLAYAWNGPSGPNRE